MAQQPEPPSPSWITDHAYKRDGNPNLLCAVCKLGEAAHEKTDHPYQVPNKQERGADGKPTGV